MASLKPAKELADIRFDDFKNLTPPNEWYEEEIKFIQSIQVDTLHFAENLVQSKYSSVHHPSTQRLLQEIKALIRAEADKLEKERD